MNMPESASNAETVQADFSHARDMDAHTDVPVSACFQCLKCTSGCPIAEQMDLGPSRVMRLIQLGQMDEVLRSNTIWLCAGCLTCSTRCPNDIDIARVMDGLRHQAMHQDLPIPRKGIRRFHQGFLKSVRRHGRLYESGMVTAYAVRQGELMKNMKLGMVMFFKGKMPYLPSKVTDRKGIKQLFAKLQARKSAKEAQKS